MAELLLRVDTARFNPIGPIERKALEAEIERLIELLDTIDGDCDIEDDDPAFDPGDDREQEEWRGIMPPLYGIDQSAGPINERQAMQRHQRERMELCQPWGDPQPWRYRSMTIEPVRRKLFNSM